MISRRKFFGMAGAGAACAAVGPPVVAGAIELVPHRFLWFEAMRVADANKWFHVERHVAHYLTGDDLIWQIKDLSEQFCVAGLSLMPSIMCNRSACKQFAKDLDGCVDDNALQPIFILDTHFHLVYVLFSKYIADFGIPCCKIYLPPSFSLSGLL